MSKFSRKIKLNKIKQQELLKTLLQNNIMSLMHYVVDSGGKFVGGGKYLKTKLDKKNALPELLL